MTLDILSDFETYPFLETLAGTSRWGYSHGPLGIDANDILYHLSDFEGTDLYIIDIENKKTYQPFKKRAMVYLEKPIYDPRKKLFGLIRYDFKAKTLEAYSYNPLENQLTLLVQIPIEKGGDLINIRLLLWPITLVKHDMHKNQTQFLWPLETNYQWEENEFLDFIDENYFYTSKWIEGPDYYEEVRLRDRHTADIRKSYLGSMSLQENGTLLILAQKNQP